MPVQNQNLPATKQETAVEKRNRELAENAWDLLNKMKPSIAKVLPKHLTPERMAMIAFTAMRRNPKLLECSQESIIGSILTAAMLGLEPSGPLGHGALIPYKGECQFQPMYQGLLELARRSGFIKDVQMRAVYRGDMYTYRFGLEPEIVHVPMEGDGADDPDREPTHVYAIIRLAGGGVQWDQMSFAQGIAHGKRYSPSYDRLKKEFKPGSVWADNPLAMILKTVLKRTLKLCPKSPELSAALVMDDMNEEGKTANMTKMADGVFDVDFGEQPEKNETARGTVDLDSLKESKEGNRGHGNENLGGVAGSTPLEGKAAAQAAPDQPQAPAIKPEPGAPLPDLDKWTTGTGDPEATCTEQQLKFLDAARDQRKVDIKAYKEFITGRLGYKLVAHLRQGDFDKVLEFIKNRGEEPNGN